MAELKDEFEHHRERCFAAAHRMLGGVADAEDTVQEVWLRWSAQERSEVADPEAYLVRIATRLALNRLRATRARRESYVGPWLPEPLVTEPAAPDAAEHALLAESAQAAMLVVLETLSPLERAVFVLREVFGYSHEDIAASLDRTSASVRQLAHRAREHVQARRPRFETNRATQRHVTERFLVACRGDDVGALLELLAPDVTLLTDGGGKVRSARNPIHGPDKVARFLGGISRRLFFEHELQLVTLNNEPGALLWFGDAPAKAMTVNVVDGRVQQVFVVSNPDKLTTLSRSASVSPRSHQGAWRRRNHASPRPSRHRSSTGRWRRCRSG